ncbi:MAG: hypothetical protein GYA35_07045, partial [Thermoanaerobaculaceae bacterium]|nr:hypothetical protein [Thermoanaerobaculaceae bacterium]
MTYSKGLYGPSYIFKSIDKGNTFFEITPPEITAPQNADSYIQKIAVDYKNENIIYVATAGGVFKSENGGDSFFKCGLDGEVVRTVAIDPANADIVFAGTKENGLFKSIDGGMNWEAANNGIEAIDISYLTIDQKNPKTIYACTEPNKIYKSVDGGNSWEEWLESCNPTFLTVDPNDSNVIYILVGEFGMSPYKTIDGGKSWTHIDVGFPFVYTIYINPLDSKNVFIGTPRGLCLSKDQAETFQCYREQFINNFLITAVACDPSNPTIVYAGTDGGGLYRSLDGGETWEYSCKGIRALFVCKVAVDPENNNLVYCGTRGGGLYKSEDFGKNWVIKDLPLSPFCFLSIEDIIFFPADPSKVYIGGSKLFRSVDNANEWSEMFYSNGDSIYTFNVALDPQNENVIYVDNSKSEDGGNTWQSFLPPVVQPGTNYVSELIVDPKNPETIYMAFRWNYIFKTVDGGKNWIEISSSIPDSAKETLCSSLALDQVNSDIVYAGFNGIYKSYDGGNNWSLKGLEGKNVISLLVDPKNSNIVYAGTLLDGVYKSIDGGENWFELNEGLSNKTIYSLTIDPKSPARIYAGTSSGIFCITQSYPEIKEARKMVDPFRLKVTGSNFHSDLKV